MPNGLNEVLGLLIILLALSAISLGNWMKFWRQVETRIETCQECQISLMELRLPSSHIQCEVEGFMAVAGRIFSFQDKARMKDECCSCSSQF